MAGQSLEIVCSACGADTLVKRVPKYEGFKKTGESFACVSCGHEFASEADVPFKIKEASNLFGKADLSPQLQVFREDEKNRNCRHCVNYVVNPFTQRCSLHNNKIVEATDSCPEFQPGKDAE